MPIMDDDLNDDLFEGRFQRPPGLRLYARPPEPVRQTGGTIDTPEHVPTRPIPRPIKVLGATLGLLAFLGLTGLIIDVVGWRRSLALASSAILALGLLTLRYVLPSPDFVEGVRREQRRQRLNVNTPDELREGQIGWRVTVGGSLTALGISGVVLATWGP